MSKVTRIIPEGATLTRADGSAVNVGDEFGDGESGTLTIPASAPVGCGGAVQFGGKGAQISERRIEDRRIPTVPPTTQTIEVPAIAVSDTAAPSRALPRASAVVPSALKVQ